MISFVKPLYLLGLCSLLPLWYYWRKTRTSLTAARSRYALWLRSLTLVCVVFALAGARIVDESSDLTVIYLLDRSLSTGGNSQGWQRQYISEALTHKGKNDLFGVILFGEDTGIERPISNQAPAELGTFTTVVDRRATGLTNALRFAATVFPGDTARRLVVLTDGQTTDTDTAREVQALSDAGIEVWMVPLPEDKAADVLLSRFEAPAQIAKNEPFLLRAVVESRGVKSCRLVITENGLPQQNLELQLRPGSNLFLLPQRKNVSGPVRYEARLLADEDQRPENNKGEALTLIGGDQTVVVLRQQEGPGSLVPLLQSAGIKATALRPGELPQAVGAWRDISCLIIEDVDSLQWSKRLQTVVNLLVREGGMGLLMCGSDQTFGVGAYQQTPIEPLLPVNLSIRRPKDQPLSALVQLLDKSGSMGGDPIKMAREAAIAAGETLSEKDLLGVVGFDSAARWVVPLEPKGDGNKFRKGVSTLRAGGGTDLYPAFSQALDKLETEQAPLKHIIILSDGAVEPGAFDRLLNRANKSRVTVSAVAFGQGADIRFLEDLTRKGKGRLFRSEQTTEGSSLAQIFIRDTVLATGSGIQEKPVAVRPTQSGLSAPLLSGLDFAQSPRLLAHNMASNKGGTAQTLLQTAKSDPILAVGRAGLGQTAAWLSDLGGEWAKPWDKQKVTGSQASLLETILLRAVRSVVASEGLPLSARGNHLEIRPGTSGQTARLEVSLSTRKPLEGPVRIVAVARNGASQELMLQPTGPYSAEGTLQVTEPGSGLVMAQSASGELLARTNFTMPLASEFTRLGTDLNTLKSWSQVPQGKFEARPEENFAPPENPVPLRTPLERDLARGALLLLLLEIAVRRLPMPKRAPASAQIEQKTRQIEARFSRLREAKSSLQSMRTPPEAAPRLEIKRAEKTPTTAPPPKRPNPGVNLEGQESTLAKLKRARKNK